MSNKKNPEIKKYKKLFENEKEKKFAVEFRKGE
jgi:hypothetical protein